jgi:hypothetical protein
LIFRHELLNLSTDTRAFALVGAYMGYFALLEEGVNEALGVILNIDGSRRIIVGRNMGFDDKLKSLRALISAFVYDEAKRQRFDKLAIRARNIGQTRNVVAHSPFRGSEQSDGVEFFAWSATKELRDLEMDWSVDRFLTEIASINQLDSEMRSIESQMTMQRIAEALTRNEAPRKGTSLPGTFGGLFLAGKALLEEEDK